MPTAASFSYEAPSVLASPNPDQRDRASREYTEYRDLVLRPDIRKRGVQVPLLAFRNAEGKKQVFDGGTRLEAALLEGLKEVPVLTYAEMPSPAELRVATFLANENRLDWTPAERGRFYLETLRREGWTQAEMCRQIPGLKQARVSKTLKWLEKLVPELHDKVGEGDGLIPERGAYKLCDFARDMQLELGLKMTQGLLTVEALEQLHAQKLSDKPPRQKPVKVKVTDDVQAVLRGDYDTLLTTLGNLMEGIRKAQKLALPLASLSHVLRQPKTA